MSSNRIIGYYRAAIFVVGILSVLSIPLNLEAFQYKEQLQERSARTFKHWNTKKKKITGFTRLSYEKEPESGDLLEISKNMDDDQSVYSEKVLSFDSTSGEIKKYEESDFRTNIKTINTYFSDKIHTEIWEKGRKTEFDIEITADLVPFEVLSLFLQSKMPDIKVRESLNFTLYLPVIASELTAKGLPLSLSQLGMKVSIKKLQEENTVYGQKETIRVRVEPTSFLIKALLPSDKSKFDFTFINHKPFDLLTFEEGDTRTILEKLD